MSFVATDEAFVGFRITREKPILLLWIGLVYAASMALTLAFVFPALTQVMAMATSIQGGQEPDQAEMLAMLKNYGQIAAVTWPISTVAMAIMGPAVVRAVLQPEDSRFGYLRLGGDEFRTFIALVLMAAMWAALILVSGVIIGISATAGVAVAFLVGLVVILAAMAAAFWLAVKLCLVVPITVMEKRIGIADSFRMTKGHFWPLAGVGVLVIVLSIGVSLLGNIVAMPFTIISDGGYGPLMGGPVTAASVIGMVGALVLSIVLTSAQALIVYSPFSSIYRRIKGV